MCPEYVQSGNRLYVAMIRSGDESLFLLHRTGSISRKWNPYVHVVWFLLVSNCGPEMRLFLLLLWCQIDSCGLLSSFQSYLLLIHFSPTDTSWGVLGCYFDPLQLGLLSEVELWSRNTFYSKHHNFSKEGSILGIIIGIDFYQDYSRILTVVSTKWKF